MELVEDRLFAVSHLVPRYGKLTCSMGRHDLVELAARKDVAGMISVCVMCSVSANGTAFPDTFDTPSVDFKSPPFNILPFETGDI